MLARKYWSFSSLNCREEDRKSNSSDVRSRMYNACALSPTDDHGPIVRPNRINYLRVQRGEIGQSDPAIHLGNAPLGALHVTPTLTIFRNLHPLQKIKGISYPRSVFADVAGALQNGNETLGGGPRLCVA